MKWLRRIRAAFVVGLLWAIPWAIAGVLLGMIVDPTGAMDEPWIAVGAYPGFITGALFSGILAVIERNRGFSQLSARRVAIWGAIAGLALGLFVISMISVDNANNGNASYRLGAIVTLAFSLLSSASAAGTLALARMGTPREEREPVSADTSTQ